MEYLKKEWFKSLLLNLIVNKLSHQTIEDLQAIIEKYPGDKPLEFNLIDTQKNYKINTYSNDKKIEICEDLILELKKIDVDYTILKN
jgi:uncharacterized protein YpuA (DUF1002 family)